MNLPQPRPGFSPQEYLEWEKLQESRNEYIAGEVFAMVGARDAHNTVTINLLVALRNHLRGGPCRTFAVEHETARRVGELLLLPRRLRHL